MGLPKEPRQKMINMMYLVLTAMLALNVSAEILNAFKTVNTSIDKSNQVITEKNQLTYNAFKDELSEEQTKAKAAIWAPKATAVGKMSNELFQYIENLKQDLKKESKLDTVDGVEHFKEDDLDAPTRMMDKQGKGKELYDKLDAYRKSIIAVVKPEEFADQPVLQDQLKKDLVMLQKSIPINLEVPKSKTGKEYKNDASGWTQNYFHMTPTIAALTILSKFQNDVKNSEALMVDYLHSQVGKVKVVFDQFQAIATANTKYAMPGDEIEVTAGIGAFSAAAKPDIYINGQLQQLTNEGTAKFTTTASGVGDKTIDVKIVYTKPDGTKFTVNKPVKYTIGTPSGASVFLEKMNVLYIGVANPVTISGGSVGAEKVNVSFPNGTIKHLGGDKYEISPKSPGEVNLVVNADGKKYPFPMRIKYLPPPTAFVGTQNGGNMSAAAFRAMGGVLAKLENSDFQVGYQVLNYNISATGGTIGSYRTASNNGPRWSGQAAALVKDAGPGTKVFIDDISVKGPDGRTIRISSINFNLQ